MIADADDAQAQLRATIEIAAGRALEAALADGDVSGDNSVAKLLASAETTAKAATGARAALPVIEAKLAEVRAEAARLQGDLRVAVIDYLRTRADEIARRYREHVEALFSLHDRLIGVSAALPLASSAGSTIQMVAPVVEVPRFALPATADRNEFLATIRHGADVATVEKNDGGLACSLSAARRRWRRGH